jgi:WD40 repeat protein
LVLSGGWDGHLRLWDAQTRAPLTAVRAGAKPVSACAVSPEMDEWLSGSLDGLLSRWDPRTQTQVSTFLAHARPISAIVFGPNRQTLATAAWDCQVMLWDLSRDRLGRALKGHIDIVAGCCFTPDGQAVVSWSHDGTVRMWDASGARLTKSFLGHADRVNAAAVSPDSSWIVSGSRDGTLKLWDPKAEREAGSCTLKTAICGCFFLLHGGAVVTIEANGRLQIISIPGLEVEMALDTGLVVECADLAPSGAQLALGGRDGQVYFVEVDGLNGTPLVVTATQTSRRTATPWQRLFGQSRLTHSILFTCPTCRQEVELPGRVPPEPAPCPHCLRPLRVGGIMVPTSEVGSPV